MPCGYHELKTVFEEIAPARLAESWDNTGLIVGVNTREVQKILVCLDVTPQTILEAAGKGADMIVSHHPILLSGTKSINDEEYEGSLITALLKNSVSLFVMHTNLDAACGGVNDCLAQALGLQNITVLQKPPEGAYLKLVVFVPPESAESVFNAICINGAGHIGAYSRCGFTSEGKGTFLPGPETHPHIGKRGEICRTPEVRLETIMPASKAGAVIKAMLDAHPYEEPAYDIYPLANTADNEGMGRLGTLQETTLAGFAQSVRKCLGSSALRAYGEAGRRIKSVAVCGGSGGSLIREAKAAGADILVTGDIRYHQALEAAWLDLLLIDAGHHETERPVISALIARLQSRTDELKYHVEIIGSEIDTRYAINVTSSPE